MGKKWYSFFVVADEPNAANVHVPGEPVASPPSPRRAEDLVPEASAAPQTSAPPPVPSAELSVVYDSAKITPPAHGYTVLKVAEMLQSEHIRALPAEVRRKSVLVALDAAGVTVEEIVEDAVRRDRALDTYERVLQQHVDKLVEATTADNRALEDEVAKRAAELRAQIDENTRRAAAGQAELQAWRQRKQHEEALIAEAVGHFVSENPVTRSASAPAPPQGDADVR